jgi:hypothetical protein
MAEQKIIIPLNEKSYKILIGIMGKYKLQENDDEALVKVKEGKLFNENIAIQLTRNLMLEKISNVEFLNALHENLKTEKETTKKIALDIVNTLIPALEKVPEDKLKEYNSRNNPENEITEKEPVIEGPGKKNTPPKKLPYSKKVEIPNVEENAKHMEKSEALQKARTVIPQSTQPKPQNSSPDTYREPIE